MVWWSRKIGRDHDYKKMSGPTCTQTDHGILRASQRLRSTALAYTFFRKEFIYTAAVSPMGLEGTVSELCETRPKLDTAYNSTSRATGKGTSGRLCTTTFHRPRKDLIPSVEVAGRQLSQSIMMPQITPIHNRSCSYMKHAL